MVHELKTWPLFFEAVKNGTKQFEVRKNDRDFQVGDDLILKEFAPKGYYEEQDADVYTGQFLHRKVSYVLKGGEFGIKNGYVVLGLRVV
jgi:hypothetical protein